MSLWVIFSCPFFFLLKSFKWFKLLETTVYCFLSTNCGLLQKFCIAGIARELKAWLSDKILCRGPGKPAMFWEAMWIYMCLIQNTNEKTFFVKCPWTDVVDANVSIPLSRNTVSDSICVMYGLGLWVCFCASHGSRSISGHKCTGDFALTGRLHQSMCTRTAIKEVITATRNPWWLLLLRDLAIF